MTVTITVNGRRQDLAEGATVATLVAALAGGPRGVAVAVNSEIVNRSRWDLTTLRPGDRVEVLSAAQGG
ncbi:MAG: sulfur carrier protein ThiS [Acidimicrobiia bacterium]